MVNLYRTALSELGDVFDRLHDQDVDTACAMIAAAHKTVVFGGGRERLQIMGLAMRLSAQASAIEMYRHAVRSWVYRK